MLGFERNSGRYYEDFAAVLRASASAPVTVDQVMSGKAIDFMGLLPGAATGGRLGRFYAVNGLRPAWAAAG